MTSVTQIKLEIIEVSLGVNLLVSKVLDYERT